MNYNFYTQKEKKEIAGNVVLNVMIAFGVVLILSIVFIIISIHSSRRFRATQTLEDISAFSRDILLSGNFYLSIPEGANISFSGLPEKTFFGYPIHAVRGKGSTYFVTVSNLPATVCKRILKEKAVEMKGIRINNTFFSGDNFELCDTASSVSFCFPGDNKSLGEFLCAPTGLCTNVTLDSCQASCDPNTGEISDKEDGEPCATGVCKGGQCVNLCTSVILGQCEASCDPATAKITNKNDGTPCDERVGVCKNGNCSHL